MKFEIVDDCPVPAQLADCVREIKRQTGATLSSCDRSPEAEPLLQRHGKQSQRQLYEGWSKRLPGYNPANPPGFSTHERRNDGAAYSGPRGMVLRYWQVGMDWSDSEAVIRAAAKLGFTATRTYPRDQREFHHLNFRREPRFKVLAPLKLGSKGGRVARLTKSLAILRDQEGTPYLAKGQGIYDEQVEAAVRRFQQDWDQNVDGVYGAQSARQLAVALRAQKQKEAEVPGTTPTEMPPLLRLGSKGARVARLTKNLTIVRDKQGNPYLDKGTGIFDEQVEAAVRRFQEDSGLGVDGIVGPQTEGRLADAVRAVEEKQQPAPGTKPTALSPAGAKFIAGFEGFRGKMYNDAAGHCTIGFGHLVHHGAINGTEPAEFKAGITRERALELLQSDAAKCAAAVSKAVKVPLTQPQFDALVSFAFNVGVGGFQESTLLKKLNAGDYAAVPPQLNRWVHAGEKKLEGLVRRRAAEGALFSTGRY